MRATWPGALTAEDLDELMCWTWSADVDGELLLGIDDSIVTAFLVGGAVNRATFERRAEHSSLAATLADVWTSLSRTVIDR